MKKYSKKIILASTSPRRREIFAKLGLPFITAEPDYEEDMTLNLPPQKLVRALSLGKARAVAQNRRSGIVVAADTIVAIGKEVLGKPHTPARAKAMLRKVSGKVVSIITGFTMIDAHSGRKVSKTVITRVYIKKLSAREIDAYVKTKEPIDKAGAFAIQGIGALIVKKVTGCFHGAVGLPLKEVADALKEFGVRVI